MLWFGGFFGGWFFVVDVVYLWCSVVVFVLGGGVGFLWCSHEFMRSVKGIIIDSKLEGPSSATLGPLKR